MAVSSSIAFLAVARIDDKAMLAERLDKGTADVEKKSIQASLATLLQRAEKLKYPNWKDQCQCSAAFDGSVYALADSQALCVVTVGVRGGLYPYPPRLVWELLKKFLEAVEQIEDVSLREAKSGALAAPLKKPMQELMKNYREPGDMDAVTQVQTKVDGVKNMMHENVRKILETHTTLEALQNKSEEMNDSAQKFVQQSTTLKRQLQVRNLKVKAMMAVAVIALGAYALLPFFSNQ